MRRRDFLRQIPVSAAFGGALAAGQLDSLDRPPNIIFVLADDLGYGDLGCFGQTKIRTPNIDRLASEGMRFTRHYSGSPVCAPSRGVLMTGKHAGHAFIRDNREIQPEGQFPLPSGTQTLARLLQLNGYATGCFGKWGLGYPGSTGDPLAQGFDRFFGYNCQRQAHNYYPTYLYDNRSRVPLNNPDFSAHQAFPSGLDPRDPASYGRYAGRDYSPDVIAGRARAFIEENKGKPFFVWMTTTVPHLALQVPDDSLQEYLGRWPEDPYLGDRNYLPHPTPRAAYAAMITRMDREVGRIVELIESLGLTRDTVVIFTSDNGPLYERLGGTDTGFFNSASGLNGRKGSLYEGGIRVPMLARWTGRIKPGSTCDRMTGFEDWLPTLLEISRLQKAVPADVDGIGFGSSLLGRSQPARPFLYREFPGYGGQQSVYREEWKGIRRNLGPGRRDESGSEMEVYNLATDPGETTDLARRYPDIADRLARLMQEQHRRSEEFPLGQEA